MLEDLTKYIVDTFPAKKLDIFNDFESFDNIKEKLLRKVFDLNTTRNVYLKDQRAKLAWYGELYSKISDASKKRSVYLPLMETAIFGFTTDGWLDKEPLFEKLTEEIKLNDSLFKSLSEHADVRLNRLTNIISKSTNMGELDDIKHYIKYSLHKETHPVEMLSKSILYPENKFLRGIVYLRPKVDKTLDRSNLDYIAQKSKFNVKKVELSTVMDLTKVRGDSNTPSKTMEYKISDIPTLMDITHKLINSVQDYISTELMVEVDLKVISNTLEAYFDVVNEHDDPELNALSNNLIDYIKNLIWCKYKLQIERVRSSRILIDHLLDVIHSLHKETF